MAPSSKSNTRFLTLEALSFTLFGKYGLQGVLVLDSREAYSVAGF